MPVLQRLTPVFRIIAIHCKASNIHGLLTQAGKICGRAASQLREDGRSVVWAGRSFYMYRPKSVYAASIKRRDFGELKQRMGDFLKRSGKAPNRLKHHGL